jgi:methyl-CpG-binding domain protein 4
VDLLETHYLNDPWKMIVACILLNRTKRIQVDRVIEPLFNRWPSSKEMAAADLESLKELLRPLGFQTRRSTALKKFSAAYMSLLTVNENTAADLPYVGAYALDAYKLFILNQVHLAPEDKDLRKVVHFRRTIISHIYERIDAWR